jgi:hypothetical protein
MTLNTFRTPAVRSAAAVFTAAALGVGIWLTTESAAQSGPCGSGTPAGDGDPSRGPHAYFASLVRRPDCYRAFSLRDAAQVREYTHSKRRPEYVSYDPSKDQDPRRQDAAKITIPAGKVSLPNQVRLPIGTADGVATLVTWDAWFGAEFHRDNFGVANYKTFQFASPADRIWFEVRTRFKQDEARNARQAGSRQRARKANAGRAGRKADAELSDPPADAPPAQGAARTAKGGLDLGVVDARAYGSKGQTLGPNVARSAPLAPQAGSFTVRAETWTRYWVLIEQRANDWDLVSLWVADENHDAVRLIDRLQLSVKRSVESFWLEYNTSSRPREGLGERVAYVRNVVMLRGVTDVTSVLRRPVR